MNKILRPENGNRINKEDTKCWNSLNEKFRNANKNYRSKQASSTEYKRWKKECQALKILLKKWTQRSKKMLKLEHYEKTKTKNDKNKKGEECQVKGLENIFNKIIEEKFTNL